MIPVCPKIAHRTSYGEWPCIRAAGHDGDCKPDIDARYYDVPVTDRDQEWLVTEVRILLEYLDAADRRFAEQRQTTARLEQLIRAIARLAPANGTRKTVPAAAVRQVWQDALNGTVEASDDHVG